jgi:hypothetical protein
MRIKKIHLLPFSLSLSLSHSLLKFVDRLCGLEVRVPGYRSRGPGFDSRRYQFFWEVVGLERGLLSLMRITEELLEWKSSGSGLENRYGRYGPRDPLRWPRDTSPTSGGRSVGIVCLRTKSHGVFFKIVLDKNVEAVWILTPSISHREELRPLWV